MRTHTRSIVAAVAVTGLAVAGASAATHAENGNSPVDSGAKVVELDPDQTDGRSTSALLTRAYVFTKSDGIFGYGVGSFTIPTLPSGTYLASYSVTMAGTAETDVGAAVSGRCGLRNGSARAAVTTSSYSGYHDIALSGSAVITVGSTPWQLVCTADHPERQWSWAIDPNQPVQVSLLHIDWATTGELPIDPVE